MFASKWGVIKLAMMMILLLVILYLMAALFYLSECKKSQPPLNQTGGVVHLLGNKPSHGLSGAGLTGDWLRANSIA